MQTDKPFDYHVYIDGSGDDGFKFEEGSSSLFTAAAFWNKPQDEPYNLEIIQGIREVIRCQPTQELKYEWMRRRRRCNEGIRLLTTLKGQLSLWVAFKRQISDPMLINPKSKFLTSTLQAFPVALLGKFLEPGSQAMVYIDKCKKIEQDRIPMTVQAFMGEECGDAARFPIQFKDWKEDNLPLLQLPDLFAGIVREFFECYEKRSSWLPCHLCRPNNRLCSYYRTHKQLEDSIRMRQILRLVPLNPSGSRQMGIWYFPMEPIFYRRLAFVDCLLRR